MNKKLEKYLRTRAITTPWKIEGTKRADFHAAVVIPALAEAESLPQTLAALATNPPECLQQTLLVMVVNHRTEASVKQRQNNQQTLAWLREKPYPQLQLAWVDASSPELELPQKEGVGLARKIGFDLALQRLEWRDSPLLISLDADTLVDESYLPAIFGHFACSGKGGAAIPFRHQPGATPEHELAIRRYELYLRSYLYGLQQAGSPYAYHTIGSAFACRAGAYLAAGGMNRRLAAEDFYFLQQLAKTSGVEILSGTLVQPSPRFSKRVPFGTGNAVQAQVDEDLMPFSFTSPAAFAQLHAWLQAVSTNWQSSAVELLDVAAGISTELATFLQQLDFAANWQKLQRNHLGKQQFSLAFHGWFDGLRTRQLLSKLDSGEPPPVAELVAELLIWGGEAELQEEAQQLRLLERLQGVDQ